MTSDIFVLFFEFMSIFNIAFSLFLNKNNRDKSYILSFITIYNIYALIFFVLSISLKSWKSAGSLRSIKYCSIGLFYLKIKLKLNKG